MSSALKWDPADDPREKADGNEMLDCFLCPHKVERRHAFFFGEIAQPGGPQVAYPELAAHKNCLQSHPLEYLWLQWRNNLDDIVKAGLPRSVLKNVR